MNSDTRTVTTAFQDPAALLQRIGWHPSEWAQLAIYAKMAPSRKVALMLQLRSAQVKALKKRLQQEHPTYTAEQLKWLFIQHLDLLRETPFHE